MENFSEWLDRMLEERGWSRSEAARRGGVSASMFDKVINQQSKPGAKFCIGIARAFDIPLSEVLIRAGLVKNPYDITETSKQIRDQIINYKVAEELDEDQKDELIQFIEFIQDRDDRNKKRDLLEKHTREAQQPPERGK